MGFKLDRLMGITLKLLSRRRWTTSEFADEYSVSTRTIYRDIQTLSLSGLPVIPFQGKGGGWELDPQYILDRRLLNTQDLANVLSGLQALKQDINAASVKNTLDKINSLMTPNKQAFIETKLQHIVIDYQPWGHRQKGLWHLDVILEAIETCSIVRFNYLNLKNEPSKRQVEPMTLVLKGNSWYLFSYCLSKQNYRLFRLSRMADLSLSDKKFIRKSQTLADYTRVQETQEKKSSLANHKLIKLKLRFTKDIWVNIGDWLGFQNITWENECGLIETDTRDEAWLYTVLLGFKDQVTVLSPPHVAKKLKQEAKKIYKSYAEI